MKKENVIQSKSFLFAVRIVRLFQFLQSEKREYILSKQILRSGTSVGAMAREAEHSESRADFVHKLAIAQKEINETVYWLELLKATDYIDDAEFTSLNEDAVEVRKIITSIIKTMKQKYQL